jgi:hypothetical protein
LFLWPTTWELVFTTLEPSSVLGFHRLFQTQPPEPSRHDNPSTNITGKGQPLAGNPCAPSGPSLPLSTHQNQDLKKKVKFFYGLPVAAFHPKTRIFTAFSATPCRFQPLGPTASALGCRVLTVFFRRDFLQPKDGFC